MRALSLAPRRSAKKDVPAAVNKAFAAFEAQIGGRAQLIAVLSMAELTPDIEAVFRAFVDPESESYPLAEICYAHGLHPGQVVTAYHHAQMQMVKVLAVSIAAARVPEVLEEIVKRALPHHEDCQYCNGVGTIPKKKKPGRGRPPKPDPCLKCGTTGKIFVNGMESQQERVLDLARLLQKGGGINILNQNNPLPSGGSRSGGLDTPLGKLHQAISAVLNGKVAAAPVLEATVMPDSSPGSTESMVSHGEP